jgi:hypothetical protein
MPPRPEASRLTLAGTAMGGDRGRGTSLRVRQGGLTQYVIRKKRSGCPPLPAVSSHPPQAGCEREYQSPAPPMPPPDGVTQLA